MAEQQAGWYPDPSGDASKLRYWDGSQWTNDFTDAQQAAPTAEAVTPEPAPEPEPVAAPVAEPVVAAEPIPVEPVAQPVEAVQPVAAQPVQQVQPVQPVPQPYQQPQPMYGNPAGAQPQPNQAYTQAPPQQSNGLAVGALICGILGLCFGLLAVVAIILGVMGRKNPVNQGMATAGMVLGIIGAVGWVISLVIIFASM